MHGNLVEKQHHEFAFAIPKSTNSIEHIILADEENMIPANVLNGNLVCKTVFKAGESTIY